MAAREPCGDGRIRTDFGREESSLNFEAVALRSERRLQSSKTFVALCLDDERRSSGRDATAKAMAASAAALGEQADGVGGRRED
jgi:hypothetical protein